MHPDWAEVRAVLLFRLAYARAICDSKLRAHRKDTRRWRGQRCARCEWTVYWIRWSRTVEACTHFLKGCRFCRGAACLGRPARHLGHQAAPPCGNVGKGSIQWIPAQCAGLAQLQVMFRGAGGGPHFLFHPPPSLWLATWTGANRSTTGEVRASRSI